jgi:serine protease AprX
MPIPDYGTLLTETLKTLKQIGGPATVVRLEQGMSTRLKLTAEEADEIKPRLTGARAYLKASGLVATNARGQWSLTPAGEATPQLADVAAVPKNVHTPPLRASVISDAFDPSHRAQLKLPPDDDTLMPVVVELNVLHELGLEGARARFTSIYQELFPAVGNDKREPVRVADTYYRCDLTMNEVRRLVQVDQPDSRDNKETVPPKKRAIYRVWPDFPVSRLTDRSVATVKGDAALRSYNSSGTGIVWAVIDSGIQASHPHFSLYETLKGDVENLHRDFTCPPDTSDSDRVSGALTDAMGHGTHVAGIIAGGLPPMPPGTYSPGFKVGQYVSISDPSTAGEDYSSIPVVQEREVLEQGCLTGVAPQCKLVSLKVLDLDRDTRSTDVILALQYIRETVNGNGALLRIHGVNLSVGYEFNARWFACGKSPICVEVDKLVRSGVVVVAAAGNTGYGALSAEQRSTSAGMALTINDPGNAELAITVGSTHRDSPYTYGVSYFSSKGPTGDGRLKPNLVAPGERITSCAAGAKHREDMKSLYGGALPPEDAPAYIDDSGTSMAAPHVSGAIAAFLSIRREFIGQPERVKELFLANATSLGRDRYFEGHGLVDLMRTIQAV